MNRGILILSYKTTPFTLVTAGLETKDPVTITDEYPFKSLSDKNRPWDDYNLHRI